MSEALVSDVSARRELVAKHGVTRVGVEELTPLDFFAVKAREE
jgi:hypothetical protein